MSAARDPAAVDRALAEASRMRALAAALLRGPAAAEVDDVLQEARLAAIGPAAPPPEELRPWLVGVVRRLAALVTRRRERQTRRELAAARPIALRPDESSPAAIAERIALHRELLAAVAALDEPCRVAITRRWLDGLPPRAIAAELGVPVATVKTRLRRGLERLRERLRQHGGGGDGEVDRRLGLLMVGLEGTVMATSTKAALAAGIAFVALAGGATWWLASPHSSSGSQSAASIAALDTVGTEGSSPLTATAVAERSEAPATVMEYPAPPPLDPRRIAAIRGIVRSDAQPIAEALVELAPSPGGRLNVCDAFAIERDPLRIQSTRSDADGRFEFLDLPRGVDFDLAASCDNRIARPLTGLRAGMEDVELRLERAATIAVTVTDASGATVADALVVATLMNDAGQAFEGCRALTDADGRGLLAPLPRGNAWVTVATPAGDAPLPVNVRVEAGEIVELPFVLGDGDVIEGTVVDDATGDPLPGAELFVEWRSGIAARAARDGRFRLASVPRWSVDTYPLVVRAAGRPTCTCLIAAPEALRGRGERLAPVVLRVPSASRTIRGRVVLPDGAPVVRALVVAVVAMEDSRFAALDEATSTRTDEAGRFDLRALRADRRHVLLIREARCEDTAICAPADELERAEIDIGDVVVDRGVLLIGQVLDDDGRPPVLPRVIAEPAEFDPDAVRRGDPTAVAAMHRSRTATARGEGRFEIDGLGAGRWKLSAKWTGCAAPVEQIVELRDGEGVREVELRASGGLALAGRFVDGTGANIKHPWMLRIELREAGGDTVVARAQTHDDTDAPTFRISGLADRPYELRVLTMMGPGHPSWFPFTIERVLAGGPELAIELAPCVTRRGRVVDDGGAAVAGVRIAAFASDGTRDASLAEGISNESGEFRLQLALGARVRIEARRGATAKDAEAEVDASIEIDWLPCFPDEPLLLQLGDARDS